MSIGGKGAGQSHLTPQQKNQIKNTITSGKDYHVSSKQQAIDFVKEKFTNLPEEIAGSRGPEGWHFDSHPINGSANVIDHINIYSKSGGFRVHITWD